MMLAFPSPSPLPLWPARGSHGGFSQSPFATGQPCVGLLPFDARRWNIVQATRKKRQNTKKKKKMIMMRKKQKERRSFPVYPCFDGGDNVAARRLCLAYSHPNDGPPDGLPSLHQFTSRWISSQSKLPFLPLSLVVQNLKKQPLDLSRMVVCWYQSRVRNGGQAMLSSTRDFLSEKSMLIIRGVAFVGSVVLLGMLSLYVQAKALTHIEKHVLPPMASIVGAYLGRNIGFQRVQSVSPLGLTLESCYVGPHQEEFSCGELPLVEIRVRPFASVQRGQIVLDAVLLQPNILVCQKRDWSWLGINTTNGKSSLRNRIDDSLDARTKVRRLSREQVASRVSKKRDDAARRSAKSGYILHGKQNSERSSMKSTQLLSQERDAILSEPFSEISTSHDIQHIAEEKGFHEALQGEEDEDKNAFEDSSFSGRIDINRSFLDCKTWFDKYFVKPVPLFKNWNMKDTTSRLECQRRNLDASAEAAREFFKRLDRSNQSNDLDDSNALMVRGSPSNRDSDLENATMNKDNPEEDLLHTLASAPTLIHEPDAIHASLKGVEGLFGSKENSDNGVIIVGQETKVDIEGKIETLDSHVNSDEVLLNEGRMEADDACAHKFTTDNCESGAETAANILKISSTENKPSDNRTVKGLSLHGTGIHIHEFDKDSSDDSSLSLSDMASLSSSKSARVQSWTQERPSWWKDSAFGTEVLGKDSFANNKVKEIANQLLAKAKSNLDAAPLHNWVPATLDSIYIRNGTLMLLAYGDVEPRLMENINGCVKLVNKCEQVDAHIIGRLQEWRTNTINGNGGKLFVKVFADMRQQKWHVKLKGNNVYAPLLERLLDVPLEWADGRTSGELSIWASKGDTFPNLSGRLNVSKLAFHILETPSSFKDVCGTLFIQGQRLFLHNATGFFGAIPLNVSGDMDLNPDGGEYRLVCQVPNVEVNALMKTLKARPPLFPLAGALKAAVYCRGPLELPVFAGSAEMSRKNVEIALNGPPSCATEAIRQYEDKGAIAAFDRIPFSYASANFTFDTDTCVADVYGIRTTLVDGGEIRGAGNLWICPEGEMDPTAVNMDLSGQVFFDSLVQHYMPEKFRSSPVKLDYVHGETKIQGSLMQPVFDIKWNAPDAKGAFSGVRGDINISHEAIAINSSAFTFDLSAKIHTAYRHILRARDRSLSELRPSPPEIEGLDFDVRMRGFDFLGLISSNLSGTPSSFTSEGVHTKLTGRAKFQGRVVKSEEGLGKFSREKPMKVETKSQQVSGVIGEILLSGLKLNQLLVAPHLSGHMEIFPTKFKLNAVGRADEHLMICFNGYANSNDSDPKLSFNSASGETHKKAILFSLERGPLRMHLDYQPSHVAKLEVRNLQLDELEISSLRGVVQKVETQLNFQKRKGHGALSVRRPRFSGVQGESLDLSFRWSGDVITLERSVLEQAYSRYELQGEYVLPGPRDHTFIDKERDGNLKTAMAGQLGSFITSLGRWRLQLEVPGAEVTDLLPVARLLSRSSDPAVVSRSKELFMQGMQHAGFFTANIKQQLENVQNWKTSLPALDEESQESIPLPGLAELKGHWQGRFDASGGGNGDTSADFDFHGNEWEWGTYKVQRVSSSGSYNNNEGLHLDKIFIQKDAATLHADGTLLGPKSNLHFAVLNFPVGLVPPLLHAIQSSTVQSIPYQTARTPITSVRGILYMEGDLRGPLVKPQCDVQVRLLDGVVGGVELGRAEVVASVTSSNRFNFNAKFEPSGRTGHVHVRGSLPLEARGLDAIEDDSKQNEITNSKRPRSWNRSKNKASEENEIEEKKHVRDRLGDEGWEVHFAESLKELDWDFSEKGAVQMDAAVKDGGMMLITALSPHLQWLQGSADLTLQVRGTAEQPTVDGVASFHRVSISSPDLPRPVSSIGGTIRVINNQLRVEGLEGRVGRKGRICVRGKLPLRANETSLRDNIELKTDFLEVRAKNTFSGQVDTQMRFTGSILAPEVSGMIKLSHGEAYLPQEKGLNTAASTLASSLTGMATGTKLAGFPRNDVTSLPDQLREQQTGNEDKTEEKREQRKSLAAVGLRNLRLVLGPELRVVYPLILNFAVSGELELNGSADPQCIKPKGTLTFENGDVNLVATQVRLNRDHPNRAKFEPEQGMDPTLDLALVGADWQLKIQGRARNWQDNLVITSTKSGEPDAFTRTEAARVFESQLADSLLEGNGQLAFKKLAAATVETLMPKIEGKGEYGLARWRLVSAPQIPNLLSLDPTTDPFKSLANLSFGTEVEVQLGKRLQASVVRQLKESEMATQWTLIYHLSSKLRILFSSIPSVDNRLLFEYSATSQN